MTHDLESSDGEDFDEPSVELPSIDDEISRLFASSADEDAWLESFRSAEQQSWPWAEDAYEVLGEVARGGQGIVYRARERSTGREVALKILRFGATRGERERFERELRATAALRHPGIVTVYGLVPNCEEPVLVMEWIHGATFREWCAGEGGDAPSRERVLSTFVAICRAVDHAHARGVLHRDLKPSNILVEHESGQPKLLDFGIARREDETRSRLTKTSEFFGTIRYASPEHLKTGSRSVDARSEVYALGVLLFEALDGELPYELGDGLEEAVRAISEAPVRALRGTLGRTWELDRVVRKALHKEPGRRYASVADLADDLERFRDGRPVQAVPDSVGYRARRLLARHPAVSALCFLVLVLSAVLAVLQLGAREERVDPLLDSLYKRLAQHKDARSVGSAADLLRDSLLGDAARLSPAERIARHHGLAHALIGRGFPNMAMPDLERALEIGEAHGFESADRKATVHRDTALAHSRLRNGLRAVHHAKIAAAVPETTPDVRFECGMTLGLIVQYCVSQDDAAKAFSDLPDRSS